jgi:hypothetical protein
MPVNGSHFIDQPWNTSFKVFLDFFKDIIGVGGVFWLIPIMVIALAIYIKTENPIMPSMFMIVSGALFSSGYIFTGETNMIIVFTVFTALGITALIGSLLYRKG